MDLASGEVDLDFVMHGDGPAVEFARHAQPGDGLWFVGPKSSSRLPADLDAVLLAGDETALPAIGRFFDERPTDAPAHVIVTIADASARQELALRESDTIRWIEAPEGHPTALADAVREAPLTTASYAWAAAESRSLLPLRRYLTRELGLPPTHVDVTGYWHAERTEQAALVGANEAPEIVAAPTPVPSPIAWFAARAAVQLGLLDILLDGGPRTVAQLADRLELPVGHVATLLPLLVRHALVTEIDGVVSIGQAGLDILEDDHLREGYDGHHADELLALAELAPALRAGVSTWQQRRGRTLAADADTDPDVAAELVEHADVLAYVLHGLTDDLLEATTDQVLVTGPGADAVVDHLGERAASWRSRLRVVTPETLEPDATGPALVLVAALALAHRTDEESLTLLAQWRQAGLTRVLVVEESRPDGLGPETAESALRTLATTGAPMRDGPALSELAEQAGWRVETTAPMGWGVEATVLLPA